jgi:Uma2 family endonuclease
MSQTAYQSPFDLSEIVANLVTEGDEPVDNILSEKHLQMLPDSLRNSWQPPQVEDGQTAPRSFWVSANVGVFYSVHEPPLVPDVFISLDVTPPPDLEAKTGRSYLSWEVGKMPDVVVEIVSNKKGGELTTKLRQYGRLGVRYYVVYDPFRLLSEDVARVYEPGLVGHYHLRQDYYMPDMGLGVTLWDGDFHGINYHQWLRWRDADGNILLTGTEHAAQEAQRAAQEAQRANKAELRAVNAEERAARLAAKLRELGLDPEQV